MKISIHAVRRTVLLLSGTCALFSAHLLHAAEQCPRDRVCVTADRLREDSGQTVGDVLEGWDLYGPFLPGILSGETVSPTDLAKSDQNCAMNTYSTTSGLPIPVTRNSTEAVRYQAAINALSRAAAGMTLDERRDAFPAGTRFVVTYSDGSQQAWTIGSTGRLSDIPASPVSTPNPTADSQRAAACRATA